METLKKYVDVINAGDFATVLFELPNIAGEVIQAIGSGRLKSAELIYSESEDLGWQLRMEVAYGWVVILPGGVGIGPTKETPIRDLTTPDERQARLTGYALLAYLNDAMQVSS